MADYEVGYGKPPKHTQFGAGNNANPQGKTSEHRKAEIRAAEAAAIVQADLVEALARVVQTAGDDLERLALIKAEVNTLLKNAQDRAFGSPQQHVDQTSSDGSASLPTRIVLVGKDDGD